MVLSIARRATFLGRAFLVAIVVVSSACGTMGQFRDANALYEKGDYLQAITLYKAASDADKMNIRYRQNYLLKKNAAVQALLADAERQRDAGDLSAAESRYQLVLQIDPDNSAAHSWLRRVADMRRHNDTLVHADELITAGRLEEAEPLVRQVQVEAPENLRAQNSMDRIRLAMAGKKQASGGLDERFKKKITLEFRDAPAKTVFEVLSKVSGINFVYDQDIRPDLKVSVFLRETPMDEAIQMIGLATQLETRVLNANSVLVFPSTPQKISDYRQLSVRSFYLQNADAKSVAEHLKAILKTETIVVDEKLNLLVMRDTPEAIRLAEKLIALEDIGEPEVMLDVEILEIKHSTLLDMGINLPDEVGLSVNPTGGNNTGSTSIPLSDLTHLNSGSIYATVPSASIKLHDELSDAKILANPKIRVKTKEKASVLIGDKVPVITSTSTSTGFVSETINYIDVGLKLEVEPSVYAGDEVSIKLNLEVSNLVREITTRSGTLSYQIGTRDAQTTLRLKDGETQILAGLINKEDRKVSTGWPGLARFPVLNRIFGSQKNDRQNTEIVLSITPHLIRNIRNPGIDELQFESGTATRLGSQASAAAASDAPAEPAAADKVAPAANPPGPGADAASPAGPLSVPSALNDTAGSSGVEAVPAAAPLVHLDWSAPKDVRAGEQFTAVLNVSAEKPIDGIPVMVGFDPKVVQVVSVEAGSFMSNGGAQSTLTKQVDAAAGNVLATVLRVGSAVSGQGPLLQITFKALAPADDASIRVLSATPSPQEAGSAKWTDLTIKIR